MSEPPADLTPARVEAILAQLPVVRRVVLHGIGEPTLNRKLPAIIELAKAHDAYVLFNTNGLLMRGRVAQEVVAARLDEARFSIDAGEASTYLTIRGADVFHRVLANATAFAKVAAAAGGHTKCSLWMTGLHTNLPELETLVRRAAAAGIREVYLQRLVFSERGNARQELALYARMTRDQEAALAQAVSLARSLGVELRGSAEALPSSMPPYGDAPWRGCWRPYRLMYVTANGNILPCCIAPFTEAPYDDLILGNAFREPLAEAWHGPRYRSWRSQMEAGEPPAACRRCGTDWAL
jgi:MoaA/NifB/PqqE/SkfB family radical SAM enzyme